MSQRASGYERREADHYPTPAWVVAALAEHVSLRGKGIWEPAVGTGDMRDAIMAAGAAWCSGSDAVQRGQEEHVFDFLSPGGYPWLSHCDGIITNPPYGPIGRTALAFIEAGIRRIADCGFLALLLPVDFDSAKGRRHVFGDCPQFAGKIILTRRIKWFDGPSSPSVNHAWFLWQRTWIGERQAPTIRYAPTEARAA